ncbi:MAG: GNAT family N-acetyltransferase [Bacteroidetes bacterium]|nr:GNAT family N-acetyltransferase [Bacteroidota bacterium]
MQNKFLIQELSDKKDQRLEDVAVLFAAMYDDMLGHGLMLTLTGDGPQKWLDSVKKSLGRFGVLYISVSEKGISGFAHGSLRLTPDFLGNKKVGVITHVFVKDVERREGAGKALVSSLEKWFADQQVHSVELQVLSANLPALGFWKKLGYQTELQQYRKLAAELY